MLVTRFPMIGFMMALIAILVVLLLSGCAGPPAAPINDGLLIEVNNASQLPSGELLLRPIPGALSGKALRDDLLRASPRRQSIAIPAMTLLRVLPEHAEPVTSDQRNPGELVEPRDAGFVRIATFFRPREQGACANYTTGLAGQQRDGRVLVFVDRAARIHGSRYTAPFIFRFDLDFPAAGIYVLSLRRHGQVITPRIVSAREPLLAHVQPVNCRNADARISAR